MEIQGEDRPALPAFTEAVLASMAEIPEVQPEAPLLPPGDIAPHMIDAGMEMWGVSHAEAKRRLQREPYLATLLQLAWSSFPLTFSGIWVDHSDGGRIKLAFTQAEAAATEALSTVFAASYPHFSTSEFQGVRAHHTYSELIAAFAAISGDWPVLLLEQFGVNGAALDVVQNTVEVYVDTQADAERLEARYALSSGVQRMSLNTPLLQLLTIIVRPDRPDLYHHTPATQGQCHSRKQCPSPMRGGLRLHLPNQGGDFQQGCSSGFVVERFPLFWVSSAGHCYSGGQEVRHDDRRVGYVESDGSHNVQFSPIDASLVPLGSNFSHSRWVYTTHGQKHQVRERSFAHEAMPGIAVCQDGHMNSSSRCGEILHPFVVQTFSNGQVNIGLMSYARRTSTLATSCQAAHGDSGGAVTSAHHGANGPLRARATVVAGSDSVCYGTHTEFIEQFFNVRVNTTH